MSSSSFWKPFAAGALASAAILLVLQQRQKPARRRKQQRRAAPTRDKTASNSEVLLDAADLDMRMIRKAEGAIRTRTSRLTVVVERCTNDFNYSAILRTAEALGIQNIYIICPPLQRANDAILTSMKGTLVKQGSDEMEGRQMHHVFAQRATEWLTVKEFATTADCISELRSSEHDIWATDLSQVAVRLSKEELPSSSSEDSFKLPPKLAIVFGTEAVGCSQEMLEEADLRVYLPLRGFADSLNISVATALVVHHLFILDPSIEGDMTEKERRTLRQDWFPVLAEKRLLSSRQKKEQKRLQLAIKVAQDIERKERVGKHALHMEQRAKMAKLPELQQQLASLESNIKEKALAAVADLIENPPLPITDMRRPDEHRDCFVGKNTRNRYTEEWSDMAATKGSKTTLNATSDFFRNRAKAATADIGGE